jgi:hypothetical protein
MGVAPHLPGSNFSRTSWPNTTNAHHYIVLTGYDGTSAATALVTYNRLLDGLQRHAGAFEDSFVTIWHVNKTTRAR